VANPAGTCYLPHMTHDVLNQPPPLENYNLFDSDRALAEGLRREGAAWAEERARAFGAIVGGEPLRWGFNANENPPELRTHDRFGHRIDEVEFHPTYHQLLGLGVRHGLHSLPWREPEPGAHVARAVLFFLLAQAEAGVGCPLSMTYSGVPALRVQPEIAREWEPRLTSFDYDPALRPAEQKSGAMCGMGMTEKQGGSDVRANTTRAVALGAGGPGAEYALTGHKWFCSAPMSDAFLVLAQAPRGLSCFFVPRFRPDGSRNVFRIQRLKDKLGNRSNASSEIEFDGTWSRLVGEEGRGVPTIIEMVNHTRLDCVIGAAAGMRAAVAQALHHTAHRAAFGRTLIDQPLMQNVLADLAIESEAATVSMLRLARAFDEGGRDAEQRAFARLATAVLKYWVCKRNPMLAAEALECLGGNGYVEESVLPRLFRESPLNGVWEGSGNVICLDVLRAMGRSPEAVELFFAEVESASDERLSRAVEAVRAELGNFEHIEMRARRVVERMAVCLQASLLLRHGAADVADLYCATRLAGDHGRAFGTLPPSAGLARIVARARPS